MKKLFIVYALVLFGLVGCSGIGGTGGTVDDTVTTPRSQKIFIGKVSQVSLQSQEFTVNGVQFKHDGAQITRDSEITTSENIKAGQMITVAASDSDEDGVYEASKIDIEEQLLGPIEAIDLDLGIVQIFGHLVYITEATNFTEKSLATLEVNNYLAVFGFRRDDGNIEATLIELLEENFSSGLDMIKVAGVVTAVNVEDGTIVVDGVEIQIDANAIRNISVGDFLSAVINLNTETPDPSAVEEVISYEKDQEIVLEGIPWRISGRNVFNLNGYQVFVPIEMMDAANIESVQDRKVIIQGVFVGDKEVLAKEIHVEQTKDFELLGNLEASDSENSILVFDQIILIDRFTFISFDLATILAEIRSGSTYTVYVKGFFENNRRIASYISINNGIDTVNVNSIEGKVETIENGILVISGVSVRLSEMVFYENAAIDGLVLLEQIMVGHSIEVQGEFSEEGVFLASSLAYR